MSRTDIGQRCPQCNKPCAVVDRPIDAPVGRCWVSRDLGSGDCTRVDSSFRVWLREQIRAHVEGREPMDTP